MTTVTAGTYMYATMGVLDSHVVKPSNFNDALLSASLAFIQDNIPLILSLQDVDIPEDIKEMISHLNGSTANSATGKQNPDFPINLSSNDYAGYCKVRRS